MGEKNEVKLLGSWNSPFSKIVHLALKLKGVGFEYVQEDTMNPSQELLKYNPILKKVPVLIHNGKPIVESLIITEYIDEIWENGPNLLPQDPYRRAKVRFWSSFIQQQLFGLLFTVMKTVGEAQERAMEEISEKLQLLEEGMKEFFPDQSSAMDCQNVGLIDLVFSSLFGRDEIEEEVIGMKILDEKKTPLLCSRVAAIKQLPLVKELTPPHEKVVGYLKFIRESALKTSAA